MSTRTQILSSMIQAIYLNNAAEIDALPRSGPRGGSNAAHIDGWTNYSNGTITKAALKTSMPVLNYWSGRCTTSSSALPACVQKPIETCYRHIFSK